MTSYSCMQQKMRFFCISPIFCLMFVLILQPKFVKSLSNCTLVEVSSVYLGTSKLNHLAIHQDDGTVFIGAMNHLYKLSHDLKLLDNVTTCSISDPENYNKILVVDYQMSQLIICGTSIACPCSAYNFNNDLIKLTRTTSTTDRIPLGWANVSTIAFIHQFNGNQNSDGHQKLVVAVSDSGYFYNQSAIAIRSLQPENFLQMDRENGNFYLKISRIDYRYHYRVNYVFGFNKGKYNYFLTTQLKFVGSTYVSKLIRVCDNGASLQQGYTQIPIECKFHNDQPYNLVQAAALGKPNSQLAKSLNIRPDDDVLFAIFSKSKDIKVTFNEPGNHSALCIYSLKAIDEKFTENIRNCFEGKGKRGFGFGLSEPQCIKNNKNISNLCASQVNMPLDGDQPITKSPVITFNTRMTAIASKLNETHNDVFIGTNTGHLKNIIVNNSSSAYELTDLLIDEGSPVNSDLLFSPKNDFLYIMTEHNLTRIKIPIRLENCSKFENFTTCTQSTHNYCGWCGSSNKCTMKCEWPNDKYSWLSDNFRSYINVTIHNSDKPYINPGEILELDIVNLPSTNDTFYCEFFLKMGNFQSVATVLEKSAGVSIFCQTPDINEILNMSSPITDNLIIKLSISTEHITNMTSTSITFSQCFTFTSCDACVSAKFGCQWHYKKKCKHGLQKHIHDSSTSINVKSRGNTSANCEMPTPSISSFWPQKGPVEGGTHITIQGRSLDYEFEDIHQHIEVAGVLCKPVKMKSISCVIEKSSTLRDREGPVVVYVNNKPVISEQHFKFADPKILEISPNRGPTYGGTQLTIKGENLDTGRLIQVFIGGISCIVYSLTSQEIKCVTTNSSAEMEAEVSVKFDQNIRNFTKKMFKYIRDPERDEIGFYINPKGIPAGGVTILIHNVTLKSSQKLIFHVHDKLHTYNSSCKVHNDSIVTCPSPYFADLENNLINNEYPKEMDFSLTDNMTGEHIPINQSLKFFLHPDPEFHYFWNTLIHLYNEYYFLIIDGRNINKACQKNDIKVFVGNHSCEVISLSSQQMICNLPKNQLSHLTDDDQDYDGILAKYDYITVQIGDHFHRNVSKPSQYHHSTLKIVICVIFACIIVVSIAALVFYLISRRKTVSKLSRQNQQLQHQVNVMGMEAITIKQYMKHVIIKNQISLDEKSSKILKLPNVEIENTKVLKARNGTSKESEYILPLDDRWEFPRNNLILGKYLGEGEFGKVIQGEAKNILKENTTTTVAVKMLKDDHSDEDMINLVSEMEMMKLIGTHVNVLSLLGCCTTDGALFVITEYAEHGNLREFLRIHLPSNGEITATDLSQNDLVMFALQVAEGMKHLASIKCIHRDLAARNVLVSENYVLKIADFGLAREVRNEEYYRKRTDGRVPLKWMAPESLCHGIYTTQSDVWSYGILLWEIFTLGGTPYPSLLDLGKLYQALSSGYRMEKPPNCFEEIHSLMQKCWSFQPSDRPPFSTVVENLEDTLLSHKVETLDRCNLYWPERNESNDQEDETDHLLG